MRRRVSRDDTVECCEELLGARLSSGAIDALLARTGEALRQPHEDLLDHARASPHLNVDEIGWRLRGSQNANYISGGLQDLRQPFTRPVARWDPYSTPNKQIHLCSASTPPGGGVHGMCGYHAARSVLRRPLR